jgi:hypothetical protein
MISIEGMNEEQERQLENENRMLSIRLSNQIFKEVKQRDKRRHLTPIRSIYHRRKEQAA